MIKKQVIGLLLITALAACKRDPDPVFSDTYILDLPPGFPEPIFPEDNALTKSRVHLGRKLFYDPILSVNNDISCATCHNPTLAFSDNVPLSFGTEGRVGFRNAPPLFNRAWHPYFMMDGGVPTLELQAIAPIEDHNEMAFNILQAGDRIAQIEGYRKLSQRAYQREPDSYVIMRALAAFQRTLVSGWSAYDNYLHNGGSLTPSELNGKNLFFSDSLACASCHNGFDFSDHSFQNNGLYMNFAPDTGRARITLQQSDVGKFKVPSLRNIEVTAPYMHDGSLATLEEVIDHYASGGFSHPNKNPVLQGFSLSPGEKNDLIAFLKTLTDQRFINDPEHRPSP